MSIDLFIYLMEKWNLSRKFIWIWKLSFPNCKKIPKYFLINFKGLGMKEVLELFKELNLFCRISEEPIQICLLVRIPSVTEEILQLLSFFEIMQPTLCKLKNWITKLKLQNSTSKLINQLMLLPSLWPLDKKEWI
jgi:hypothetical protein